MSPPVLDVAVVRNLIWMIFPAYRDNGTFTLTLHVDGAELVRVISVWGAAGRAEAGLGLLDPVPAPHANLVATFAWEELLVGYVEVLAA